MGEAKPTADGPQGGYHVGMQTQSSEPYLVRRHSGHDDGHGEVHGKRAFWHTKPCSGAACACF